MTAHALFDISLGGRPRRELAPGAVHVPSSLTSGQQQWIAGQFREWASGPVPARVAKVRGHEMSVRPVCLGWHLLGMHQDKDERDDAHDQLEDVHTARR
jgi:DNA oxidative demethylase